MNVIKNMRIESIGYLINIYEEAKDNAWKMAGCYTACLEVIAERVMRRMISGEQGRRIEEMAIEQVNDTTNVVQVIDVLIRSIWCINYRMVDYEREEMREAMRRIVGERSESEFVESVRVGMREIRVRVSLNMEILNMIIDNYREQVEGIK